MLLFMSVSLVLSMKGVESSFFLKTDWENYASQPFMCYVKNENKKAPYTAIL
jgi:hypothetical protein